MWITMIIGALVGMCAGLFLGAFAKWKNVYGPAAIGALIGGALPVFAAGAYSGGGPDFPSVQTPAEFQEEVLESPTPVLVDFYTDTCPACKKLAPTLTELEKEYSGKVKFVKVNVNRTHEVAGEYGIRAVPTVILFHRGEVVMKWLGNLPASEYRPALDAIAPSIVELQMQPAMGGLRPEIGANGSSLDTFAIQDSING